MQCYDCGTGDTVFVVRDDLAYDTMSGDVIAVCNDQRTAELALERAKASGRYYDPEIVEGVPMLFHPDDAERLTRTEDTDGTP